MIRFLVSTNVNRAFYNKMYYNVKKKSVITPLTIKPPLVIQIHKWKGQNLFFF